MKLEYAGEYFHLNKRKPAAPWQILVCGERLIAAIGVGYPGAWSGTDYNIGESAARLAVKHLCAADEISVAAFQAAFADVRRLLRDEFPYNHDTADDIMFEDNASTTLLTAIIAGAKVFIAWRGTEEAFHVRNNQIVAHTTGHTHANFIRQHHPDKYIDVQALQHTWMKYLEASSEETTPDVLETPWQLQVGDVLVVTTTYVYEAMGEGSLPHYIEGKSASEACEALMQVGGESKWGQIVIVIRALAD